MLDVKTQMRGRPARPGGAAPKHLMERHASKYGSPASVPPIVHDVLRSPGQPLDQESRTFFEPRFGHDFSKVRIHADVRAAESARAMMALAYAAGPRLVFAEGQYAPNTSEGRQLLAHELTHVLQHGFSAPTGLTIGQPDDAYERSADASQQEGNTSSSPQMSLRVSHVSDPAEREADTAASLVLAGGKVHVEKRPAAMIYRAYVGTAIGAGAGALVGAGAGALLGSLVAGPLGALVGAGLGALAGGIAGAFLGSYLTTPLDMSAFQSPGASGWWGAKFGCYRDNCSRRHPAWDIHAPVGTKIRAVAIGTVSHGENPGGWGHYIRLRSKLDPSRTYLYGHLSNRKPAGDYLPGQDLGETGTSGNAQANRPHLHFEVLSNGVAEDPAKYFSEPKKVVEAAGSAATSIDKSAAAPCKPCAM